MPVYELEVTRVNGLTDRLYTDRRVRVGDRIRIGSSMVLVIGPERASRNRLVSATFACREDERLSNWDPGSRAA
jgi:hypothetical protein